MRWAGIDRRIVTFVFAILIGVGFYIVPADAFSTPSASNVEDSMEFVDRLNSTRASVGLPPLKWSDDLARAAMLWTNSMERGICPDGKYICHSSPISTFVTADWLVLGENVGTGPDVKEVHDGFVASPSHYKNMVDPNFTHIGVATIWKGNRLYTTHKFMQTDRLAASSGDFSLSNDGRSVQVPLTLTCNEPSEIQVFSKPDSTAEVKNRFSCGLDTTTHTLKLNSVLLGESEWVTITFKNRNGKFITTNRRRLPERPIHTVQAPTNTFSPEAVIRRPTTTAPVTTTTTTQRTVPPTTRASISTTWHGLGNTTTTPPKTTVTTRPPTTQSVTTVPKTSIAPRVLSLKALLKNEKLKVFEGTISCQPGSQLRLSYHLTSSTGSQTVGQGIRSSTFPCNGNGYATVDALVRDQVEMGAGGGNVHSYNLTVTFTDTQSGLSNSVSAHGITRSNQVNGTGFALT